MSIKRNEGEDFQAFKYRRNDANLKDKQDRKPKMFWDSYNLGTYENPEKREYKQQFTKHGRKQLNKGIK